MIRILPKAVAKSNATGNTTTSNNTTKNTANDKSNNRTNVTANNQLPAGGQSTPSGAGAGVVIIRDSGNVEILDNNSGQANGSKAVGGKININTASAEELDTLPGIGRATAADIIEYREKHGKFKKIEDIMKVTGIKENKFNKIKDYITVD